MYDKKQNNTFGKPQLTELHQRLRQVLSEYKPISEMQDKSGTYKAITQDGDVYLVTWTFEENKLPHRSSEFVMDYQTLKRTSMDAKQPRPDQGWVIE